MNRDKFFFILPERVKDEIYKNLQQLKKTLAVGFVFDQNRQFKCYRFYSHVTDITSRNDDAFLLGTGEIFDLYVVSKLWERIVAK